VRFETLA